MLRHELQAEGLLQSLEHHLLLHTQRLIYPILSSRSRRGMGCVGYSRRPWWMSRLTLSSRSRRGMGCIGYSRRPWWIRRLTHRRLHLW